MNFRPFVEELIRHVTNDY